MAKFFEDHNPFDWDSDVERMLKSMPDYKQFMQDPVSQMLLHAALFDYDVEAGERLVARHMIQEYWEDHWGYEFDDFFDWDGWRDWVSPGGD